MSRSPGAPPPVRSASVVDACYRRTGFAVERAVLTADAIGRAREESDRLFRDDELTRPDNVRTRTRTSLDGTTVVDRLDFVGDVSPVFTELARHPALCGLAAGYLEEPALLFKDKLVTKPPGTGGYGLHQDYMRWQDFLPTADELVTLAVSLDHATALSGAVEIYVGQHDRLLTPPGVVADPRPEDVDATRIERIDLAPGDVLVLHSLLPHRSDYNRSQRPRRLWFLTFAPARYGDLRPEHFARFAELFAAPAAR